MQHQLLLVIAEVHVQKLHLTGELLIGHGAVLLMGVLPGPHTGTFGGLGEDAVYLLGVHKGHVALVLLGRLVHHLEDALGSRQGHDHYVELLGYLAYGHCEASAKLQKRRYAAKSQSANAAYGQRAPGDGYQGVLQMPQVVHDRAHYVGEAVGPGGVASKLVVELVEVRLGVLLVAEDLYHLLPGDHLLDISVDGPQRLLLAHEIFARHTAYLAGEQQHKRHHHQHQDSQRYTRGYHGDEHRHKGYHSVKKLRDTL